MSYEVVFYNQNVDYLTNNAMWKQSSEAQQVIRTLLQKHKSVYYKKLSREALHVKSVEQEYAKQISWLKTQKILFELRTKSPTYLEQRKDIPTKIIFTFNTSSDAALFKLKWC